jgi:hypothetical protein
MYNNFSAVCGMRGMRKRTHNKLNKLNASVETALKCGFSYGVIGKNEAVENYYFRTE